jgi:hypothetical protein
MNKLNKKTLFMSALVAVFAVLLLMIVRKETPPKVITAKDEMPDFNFQLIDGGHIQRADMDSEKYTLIWFFNSECDLCINETQALVDSISLLNHCQIVMVSHEDSVKIADFNKRFRLMDFSFIYVACVPEEYLRNMFKIYINPTLYVYHPDRRMLKYKPGPVTIQEIVQYLKK